jgi:DNA-binding CsgD family transcriptional regulator
VAQTSAEARLFANPKEQGFPLATKLIAAIVMYGVSFGLMLGIRPAFGPAAVTAANGFAFAAAGAVAIVIMLTLVRNKALPLGTWYRLVLPLMATGFVLLAMPGETMRIVASIITMLGFVLFDMLVWFALSASAYESGCSSIEVFGWGKSSVCSGIFLGLMFGSRLGRITGGSVSLVAVSTAVAFGLFVATSLLVTDRQLPVLGQSVKLAASGGGETPSAESHRLPLWRQSCDQLAAEYGLSPREAELLVLLAKGQRPNRIGKALYISRGTVNTHMRHIYQKLGVHSQEGLVDLVEANFRSLCDSNQHLEADSQG